MSTVMRARLRAASLITGTLAAGLLATTTASAQDLPAAAPSGDPGPAVSAGHDVGISAAPGTDFYVNGVRLHASPSARSRVNGIGYKGDRITQLDTAMLPKGMYYCHKSHSWDPWWMKVRDRRTGVAGWTPQCFINLKPGGSVG